jgi:hypothetical protein
LYGRLEDLLFMHKKSRGNGKEENEMDANIMQPVKRYCSISESLKQSCLEVKLMREGKIPEKSWSQLREELKKIKGDDE